MYGLAGGGEGGGEGGGGVNLSAHQVSSAKITCRESTCLMISSLYNYKDSVIAGYCVTTANEANTIPPSACTLLEDGFGCPYVQ